MNGVGMMGMPQHQAFGGFSSGAPTRPAGQSLPHGQIIQTLRVPVHAAGNIIGRGGSIIKQIMEQSGAHVQMEQQSEMSPHAIDRGVTITGAPDQVAFAVSEIENIIRERSTAAGGVTAYPGVPPTAVPFPSASTGPDGSKQAIYTMQVPVLAVGRLIGTGGSVIKQLIAGSGAHIKFQQKEEMPHNAPDREVYISGSEAAITKARQMIDEIVQNENGAPPTGGLTSFIHQANTEGKRVLVVPDRKVGSLIGRSGVVIKKLMSDSGARIQIQQKADMRGDEREVTITGPGHSVEVATRLITQLLENEGGAGAYENMTFNPASFASPYAPAAVAPAAYPQYSGFGQHGSWPQQNYPPQYAGYHHQMPAYEPYSGHAQPAHGRDESAHGGGGEHAQPQQYADYYAQMQYSSQHYPSQQ